jgi:hypothetical protein
MFAIGAGGPIRAHHGSMSRERRHEMEEDLKAGRLPALVGTSSLELGIDIGAVDLVVQLQSPKSVAQGLQRVGRSGHLVGQTSRGRIYATHRDDLVEAAAVARGMLEGDVEPTRAPRAPLDVLTQQVLAMVSVEPWNGTALFELARGAYPYRDLTREEFDLAALIRDAANDWLPQAFRRGIEVDFELAETRVFGSPHAWREMLANLVDNAIRYGGSPGRITVRCLLDGEDVVVQVDDDGPGIPAAEREKVFERFYRPIDTSADGCGLGLPIVRALAGQQGAKVSLGDTPSGIGLRAEVRAPRTAVRESGA